MLLTTEATTRIPPELQDEIAAAALLAALADWEFPLDAGTGRRRAQVRIDGEPVLEMTLTAAFALIEDTVANETFAE